MSRKKKFKKRIIIIPLICVIIVSVIISFVVSKKYSDSFVKVIPVSESGGMFEQTDAGKILIYGSLKKGSVRNVNVNSELTIDEIKVEKGDTVEKGDVLLTYDIDLLKLNVDTNQTQVDILTKNIKVAENELLTLKGLIPLENAPVDETPVIPEDNYVVEGDVPEAVECEKQITEKTIPLSGDGNEISPFIFNVGENTIVTKQYMQYLAGEKIADTVTQATAPTEKTTEGADEQIKKNSKYAMFHIYNEKGILLYSWLVDGTKLTDNDIADWKCSKGVVISEDGSIQVNQGENPFATLVTYNVDNSNEDLYSEYTESDIPVEYEDTQNGVLANSEEDVTNRNYMYTQAELRDMISEKEDEINNLKFNKRQSEIDLSNAKKDLENGDEIADISGTVTFVAQSAEEAIKEGAYIKIVNDTITNVVGSVSENDLPYLAVGMSVTAVSDINGEECDGEITHISEGVSQGEGDYGSFGSYDDTMSYYDVTVELKEKLELEEDESITIIINTDKSNEGVWIETAFVRSENGKNYVMVANEDNVIEKRYVELGQSYYDMSIEVKSGLSADDRIALPYGKTVEGMPVVDSTYDDLYMGFLF